MRYYYKPERRTGLYAVSCFLFLILAVASAALGIIFKKAFLYIVTFSFLCLSVQIFTVFILSYYEYEADGRFFMIYRKTGKNRQRIFDLDLNFASAPVTYKEARETAKRSGVRYRRFYCTSGVPRRKCRVLIYDAGEPCMLYFAADDGFCAILGTRTASRPEE